MVSISTYIPIQVHISVFVPHVIQLGLITNSANLRSDPQFFHCFDPSRPATLLKACLFLPLTPSVPVCAILTNPWLELAVVEALRVSPGN